MEIIQERNTGTILTRLRLADPKTDIFLAANALDAALTYLALQHETMFTEFNYILYSVMNSIGIGRTLFLKLCLSVGILWLLRKTSREDLLVPLSVVLAILSLANLMLLRAYGVEV